MKYDNKVKIEIAMEPITNRSNILQTLYPSYVKKENEKEDKTSDSIEISNTSKAFAKLDNFLNLGKSDRLDTSDLNEEERKEFLKMLSDLIKKGIVGYEILEVNGKPEKHYIVNQIGDERTYGAKLYKKNGYD
jgi:hypothetical protein